MILRDLQFGGQAIPVGVEDNTELLRVPGTLGMSGRSGLGPMFRKLKYQAQESALYLSQMESD